MHNCLLEGEKEGNEKVGRTMESHEETERREGRGGRCTMWQVSEKERELGM